MTKYRWPGLLFFLCGMDQMEIKLRRNNGITKWVFESPTRYQGTAKQVCGSKGKEQRKVAVDVIAKFLIQKNGAFLPASKKEEADVVTISIRKQR